MTVSNESPERVRLRQSNGVAVGDNARENPIGARATSLRIVAHQHKDFPSELQAALLVFSELLPSKHRRAHAIHGNRTANALTEAM